jgi:hypothetical protein
MSSNGNFGFSAATPKKKKEAHVKGSRCSRGGELGFSKN